MLKLLDNELLLTWNDNRNKTRNNLIEIFKNFMKEINIFDLRNSSIISCREIDETKHILLTLKTIKDERYQYQIYNLVTINNFDLIENYCTINNEVFDIIDTIVNYKVLQLVNVVGVALDEKFSDMIKNNFSVINHKINKTQNINFLVRPDKISNDKSLAQIIQKHKDQFEFLNNYYPPQFNTTPNPMFVQSKNYEISQVTYENNYQTEELVEKPIEKQVEKQGPAEKQHLVKKQDPLLKPTQQADTSEDYKMTETINTDTYDHVVNEVDDIDFLVDSITFSSVEAPKKKAELRL